MKKSPLSHILSPAPSILALATLANAALPKIDFASMGTVAVAGAFAGFDLYDPSTSSQFNPSAATLLLRPSDGSLHPLTETNQGGSITAACTLGGKLYFAGQFSNAGSVAASNVASYDPAHASFSPLGGSAAGLDGAVSSLYCDASRNTLWVGGSFKAPTSSANGHTLQYGGAVARYYPANDSWAPAPFVGFSGQVASITPSLSSTLLFSGSFLTQYGSNITVAQGVSNPAVPTSSGATQFTTSLVPVPLAHSEVVGSPSSTTSGFNNITNILCPSGGDGPGSTWRAQDGVQAVVTVRTFRFITASGIRLGNTFLDGRGVQTFSVTSIPDNKLLQLTYVDPTTKQSVTCSDKCTLSHDASIPYQDFTFDPTTITGFQVNVSSWYGAGSGLHILQLLSNGAFASAIGGDNLESCYAPTASQVQASGQWRTVNAYTDIAGTTQNVLSASVPVGTSSGNAPSVTWFPYVSASGTYDVYLMVPGCQNLQDCANRTTVKVTLNPGGGLPVATTTVSEQVTSDTNQLIYSGPIYPSAPGFNSTVTLTLADSPAGQGSNGQYDLVADRVQFVLTSTNVANGTAGTNATASGPAQAGFGFYEWNPSAPDVNATGVLANTTLTNLDHLSSALYTALGSAVTSSGASIHSVVSYATDSVIFAGQFSLANVGATNFAAYAGGSIIKVGGSGLNGVVNAMTTADSKTIYVGGAFTDTADSNNGRYRGVVAYTVASSSWTALGGGVNGVVTDVSVANNQVNVAGNFTHVFSSASDTTGVAAGGFATYDLASNSWVNSGGFLVGSMSLAVAGDGNSTAQYIAGNVAASSQFGASGWAILENGKDGEPEVKPINAQLGSVGSGSAPAAAKTKRHKPSASWAARAASHLPWTKRQSTATLPTTPSAAAPAVLAGAFWTNSSTSNEVAILGGNFSVGSTGSSIAVYDAGLKTLKALQGNQVQGVVQALLVTGNTLFVGGDFSINGVQGQGFGEFDLAAQQWVTQGNQGLQAASGAVTVRSITASNAVPNTIIVAGTFSTAGGQPCEAICSWDNSAKTWKALGGGIHGSIAAVDYAGSNQDTVVVGGAISLADGTASNVAIYSLTNSTWKGLPTTPGPVTAISVNNLNASSIFAAGRTTDGSNPFLVHWDGATWTSQTNSFVGATSITQLKFVPLQDTHASNSVIDSDRMLFISGALDSSTQGVMSSALYDGQSFYPYLVTSASDGEPGYVSSLFSSYSSFSFNHKKFLAVGIVILISLAIATGIVFLILLIGILWTLCSRREAAVANPNPEEDDDESSFRHHRPSSLLEHINAATRTTILGAGAAGALATNRKGDPSADTHGESDHWQRPETPSDAMGMAMDEGDYGDVNRPTHARYSFAGGAEGELPVQAGQEVIVLDDRDQAWWYVRDPLTGKEGVVPASYLY